jgi:hypothetical protein
MCHVCDPQKLWFRHFKSLSVHKSPTQNRSRHPNLHIAHDNVYNTVSFINEDRTVSMGKNKFEEYGPSETQQGRNTNVTTPELK